MRRTTIRPKRLGLVVVLTLALIVAFSGLWPDPVKGDQIVTVEIRSGSIGVGPAQLMEFVVLNPCESSAATVLMQFIDAVTGEVHRTFEGEIQPGKGFRRKIFEGVGNPAERRNIRVTVKITCEGKFAKGCNFLSLSLVGDDILEVTVTSNSDFSYSGNAPFSCRVPLEQ